MAKVYLAGPITGQSYEEARNGWRKEFAGYLDFNIQPLSPMRQEGHLAEIKKISGHGYDHNQLSTDKGIFSKDKLDIERCAIAVFNFLGAPRVSIGSVWEMGYAHARGTPIILIMESGEEVENIHDHCFVTEAASYRCTTVREAAQIVNALLTPGI